MDDNEGKLIDEAFSKDPVQPHSDKEPHMAAEGKFSKHSEYMPHTTLLTLDTALARIANNTEEYPERLSFLDFEQIRAPRLKSDYEYPVLHEFLPF